MAATGTPSRCSTRPSSTPSCRGTSLGQFDPGVPIPAPGVLLQPDRELGAAFFDDHATQLAALNPRIDIVRVHGVGHLIHDSATHRDEYLAQLDRFLATYAPA